MNTFRILLVILLVGVEPMSQAAQTAQARMHCWSLRFGSASASGAGGFAWELDLTTLPYGLNGELAPDYVGGYSHYSFVDLYDSLFEEVYPGELGLDVPDGGDANGNGFPDFFEVSQPVNGLVSSGSLQVVGLSYLANVQATWQRTSGSPFGTCVLSIPDPFNPFGTLNFFHPFTLIEYKGLLTYTPGATNVSCTLSVTNNDLFDTLEGPLEFEKSASDPANELTLLSAALRNIYSQPLGFYIDTLFGRDAAYPSNYFGLVEVLDGEPFRTPGDDDYYTWQLSIDDLNDSDHDGIPDFSDSLNVAPPRQPELTLTHGSGNLLLSISGDVGVQHLIERASAATGATWTTATSVTLTNDPQTVSLSMPTNTTFWRARVPVSP
jgi:hypothetical protein